MSAENSVNEDQLTGQESLQGNSFPLLSSMLLYHKRGKKEGNKRRRDQKLSCRRG